MEQYLVDNWQYILAGFYIVEKIVKLTPTKYDDILVDVIWNGLKKVAKKK